jgi:hypothetical protein
LKNGVILLFMMYFKFPLIKVGIIEIFVDVKKMFMLHIFKYAQSNFIFEMGFFFHKMPLE